ncbi:DUF4344 domain-containing metallopeptidase [Nonomuraea sp. NPDC050328]|uniref:DUF4344 domain-containing metallopeptidase n=1 Tax=Nonomuraea sp. NPDC050328 TaxID=3364361 RepID=UPI0037A62F9F
MRLIVLGVLALMLAGCVAPFRPARPAAGGASVPPPSPSTSPSTSPSAGSPYRFTAGYVRPGNRDLGPAAALMSGRNLVQEWAAAANAGFAPPVDVPIVAKQCDMVNAFYDPEERSLTMCYEMAAYLGKLFAQPEKGEEPPPAEEVDERVVGALNGIFFHELGHGLIDLYDLPTTGKEEDAVDQLSALVLIGEAEESKDYTGILATIGAWGRMAESEEGALGKEDYADEHSLSGQRYYTMMCYLYGSDHNAFLPLVAEGELPVARAQRCEQEYAKMADSWGRLLAPHMRTDPPTPTASPTSSTTGPPTGLPTSTPPEDPATVPAPELTPTS